MRTRSEQLRDQYRKIFAWSLTAAVVVHVAVFVLVPGFHAKALYPGESLRRDTTASGGQGTPIHVLFGPPSIDVPGGGTWVEPPERVLEVDRAVDLPPGCRALSRAGGATLHGRVRLRVDSAGLAGVVQLAESTGHPCADRAMALVAGDLWYHWLPDARFAAPVDLVQPVTLTELP
jgi:hypothetical protein